MWPPRRPVSNLQGASPVVTFTSAVTGHEYGPELAETDSPLAQKENVGRPEVAAARRDP